MVTFIKGNMQQKLIKHSADPHLIGSLMFKFGFGCLNDTFDHFHPHSKILIYTDHQFSYE